MALAGVRGLDMEAGDWNAGGGEMAVRKNKGWLGGVGTPPDRAADRCDILPDCRDSLQKRHPVERLLKRQTYVLQR